MGKKCFVTYCTSGYGSNKEKMSMFSPNRNNIFDWIKAIPRKDKILTLKDAVCEKHFAKNEIIREISTITYSYPLRKPKLIHGAIPSIFPDQPHSFTKRKSYMKKSNCIQKIERSRFDETIMNHDTEFKIEVTETSIYEPPQEDILCNLNNVISDKSRSILNEVKTPKHSLYEELKIHNSAILKDNKLQNQIDGSVSNKKIKSETSRESAIINLDEVNSDIRDNLSWNDSADETDIVEDVDLDYDD